MELEPAYANLLSTTDTLSLSSEAAALYNKGKRWSEEENSRLLEEIKAGITFTEIGKSHGRTATAIKSHLIEIAIKMIYEEKRDENEVIALTELTKEEIEEAKRKKDSRQRKPKAKSQESPKTASPRKSIASKTQQETDSGKSEVIPQIPTNNLQKDIAQMKNDIHVIHLKLDKVIEYFNMILSSGNSSTTQ